MELSKKNPETYPHVYGHLIHSKCTTAIQEWKDGLFSKGCNGISIWKNNFLRWIDLNVKGKAVKFLEENTEDLTILR